LEAWKCPARLARFTASLQTGSLVVAVSQLVEQNSSFSVRLSAVLVLLLIVLGFFMQHVCVRVALAPEHGACTVAHSAWVAEKTHAASASCLRSACLPASRWRCASERMWSMYGHGVISQFSSPEAVSWFARLHLLRGAFAAVAVVLLPRVVSSDQRCPLAAAISVLPAFATAVVLVLWRPHRNPARRYVQPIVSFLVSAIILSAITLTAASADTHAARVAWDLVDGCSCIAFAVAGCFATLAIACDPDSVEYPRAATIETPWIPPPPSTFRKRRVDDSYAPRFPATAPPGVHEPGWFHNAAGDYFGPRPRQFPREDDPDL
jgi:hypothetical protein